MDSRTTKKQPSSCISTNDSHSAGTQRLLLPGQPAPRYSILSASIGEMDAARFAGMIAAKNEQTASAPAARLSANGSHALTPYSCAEINLPAPTASGNPRISPASTRLNAPLSTCAWRIVISLMIPQDFPSCYYSSMRNLAVLVIHLIATLARLLGPGGVRSLVAESLLLKHQLLIVNRSRQRSPNLSAGDRILAGLLALLVRPTRLLRSAIALKPSTLLGLHKVLSKQKYRMLFSTNRRRKPGPKGASTDLIHAVVEMKQRNPNWGCPRIAHRSPWRSTSQSTKTWFAGFSLITTGRDRTPMALPG